MNKGGGSIYTLDEIKPIQALCQEKRLKAPFGPEARLFNALVGSRRVSS
jgi:threonine aldolase